MSGESSSVVTGRYQEDYPESYKKDVRLESEEESSRSMAVAEGMLERGARRAAALATAEVRALTPAEVAAEYEYCTWRLFGETPGLEVYEEGSDEFDEVFRDSVDEVAALWVDTYNERFGREPPVGVVGYAYPMRGVSLADRVRFRQALDAEYARLRASSPQEDFGFLSVPKGLTRN
ncbi:hypothetical protein CTAYLR_003038 [Chrysophaeum taylorii]|uniref:Uncharacterized protein n=1 Tax=Chrysophaeum taylorii TaxID=2483200 RepID=A0AAD7XEU6_9STRA|nr:hypothetical protein CTAYLR_003038 [Chrysophaeum taylorii]